MSGYDCPPLGVPRPQEVPRAIEGTSTVASRVGGRFEQLRISLPPEGAGALQTTTRKPFTQKRSLRFFCE